MPKCRAYAIKHKKALILTKDRGERNLNSEKGTTGTSWAAREQTWPQATFNFLDLILPTILRLQTAVKLIKLSTVPTNGLGHNGALSMPSFTIRHDMSERQEMSLWANLLASRQINIVEDNVMQFYIQF